MLFSSNVFLFCFLPAVLAGYHILFRGMRRQQNLFLLAASLFFYAWGEWRFLPLMVLSIAMNYGFGLWVHRCQLRGEPTKQPVTAAVGCNLGLLFVFKYLAFTLESINALGLSLPVPQIVLPIGISFFTFQALSYVLDVAAGRVAVQRSVLDLGLYISFFPQLIAGPIVKYSTVALEIRGRKESWADFSSGCSRFLAGLGKKVLLANQLAVVADRVFATSPAQLSQAMAWLGAICYTLQIYYDFSGYSDMAIGLGRMFGFHFLENFDHPYAAVSVTQFWRRWHISLSTWFRDYLYIPLGGNRVEVKKHIRNLFLVWLFTGLWHGANWTFVAWGLGYFLLLLFEKYVPAYKEKVPAALRWVLTLLCVTLLWVVFRSDSLGYAGGFFKAMLGLGGAIRSDGLARFYLRENALVLLLALFFALPLAGKLGKALYTPRPDRPDLSPLWDILYALGLLGIGMLSVACLVKGTYNPFIYFRF